jgi:diadenosine tetraphosphate (Ap4A) HIT family hydrolase
MAEIHPQLKSDCIYVGRFELCHLLLMDDASYPWCILVPDREGITEIHQLTTSERAQLMEESTRLSRCLESLFRPDSLNVASLGNLVPQLHIHHLARFRQDPAWPGPVWGHAPAKSYAPEAAEAVRQQLLSCLGDSLKSS